MTGLGGMIERFLYGYRIIMIEDKEIIPGDPLAFVMIIPDRFIRNGLKTEIGVIGVQGILHHILPFPVDHKSDQCNDHDGDQRKGKRNKDKAKEQKNTNQDQWDSERRLSGFCPALFSQELSGDLRLHKISPLCRHRQLSGIRTLSGSGKGILLLCHSGIRTFIRSKRIEGASSASR